MEAQSASLGSLCRIFPAMVRDFPAGSGYAVFLQFHVLNLNVCAAVGRATMTATKREGLNPKCEGGISV